MKVVCNESCFRSTPMTGTCSVITKYKVYDVLNSNYSLVGEWSFNIINDLGQCEWFDRKRFFTLEEYRNIQIDKIL